MPQTPAWYLPACPPWCDRTHPAILTADPDEHPDGTDVLEHAHTLAHAAGLTIAWGQWQTHPASVATLPQGPRLYLTLPEDHDAEGTDPATLHAWADALTQAAHAASGPPAPTPAGTPAPVLPRCAVLRCDQPAAWRYTLTDPGECFTRDYCAAHAGAKLTSHASPGRQVTLESIGGTP